MSSSWNCNWVYGLRIAQFSDLIGFPLAHLREYYFILSFFLHCTPNFAVKINFATLPLSYAHSHTHTLIYTYIAIIVSLINCTSIKITYRRFGLRGTWERWGGWICFLFLSNVLAALAIIRGTRGGGGRGVVWHDSRRFKQACVNLFKK